MLTLSPNPMKKLLTTLATFVVALSTYAQSYFYTNSSAGLYTNTLSIDANSFPILLTGITVTVTNPVYLRFYDSTDNTGRYTNTLFTANRLGTGWATNYYTNFFVGTSNSIQVTNLLIGSNIARVLLATNYTTTTVSNELPRIVEAYFQPSAPGVLTPSTIAGRWSFARGVTLATGSNSPFLLQLQYTK